MMVVGFSDIVMSVAAVLLLVFHRKVSPGFLAAALAVVCLAWAGKKALALGLVMLAVAAGSGLLRGGRQES